MKKQLQKSTMYLKGSIVAFIIMLSLSLSSQVTGVWSSITPYPGTPAYHCISFSIGNKIYVGGGNISSPTMCYQGFYEYDESTNTWTQKANLPTSGYYGAAFSIGNKGYVVAFGCGSSHAVYEYDQTTDTWSIKSNYPGSATRRSSTFVLGNKGYIALGESSGGGPFNQLWQYDNVSDIWTQKASFPGAQRTGQFGFALNGKGYVGGGRNYTTSWQYYSDVYAYDTLTDSWSSVANYPGPTGSTAQENTSGLSMGGYGYVGWYNYALWRYNPTTDSWSQMANMPTSPVVGAYGPMSVATSNYIYYGVGFDNVSTYYTNVKRWHECSTAPVIPVAISGSSVVCTNSQKTYSVAAVANAGSYTWVLPGWSGTSTSNIITTTVNASGTISVTANNSCGSSSTQTLAVTFGSPSQPSTIAGNTALCSGSSNIYSVTPVNGATSYSWGKPVGWSGTSTTNTISATAGVNSGNITVIATNTCGSSPTQTLAVVVGAPAAPIAVNGNSVICSGSSNTYSVATVSGATSYSWALPGGWSGTSTTNSITATANNTGGTLTVSAVNSCGNSAIKTLTITVNQIPAMPSAISGTATLCSGSTNTYSVPIVSGATSYNWSLPSGWLGTSTSNSINATTGTASGNISVTASNSCGASSAQTLSITVNSKPTITVNSGTICSGQSFTMSPSGASTYTYSGGSAVVSPATNASYSVSGTSAAGCVSASSAVSSVTVNALPIVNATTSNTLMCTGETVTLTASGAASYTFNPGGVGASVVVSPTVTSSYTVSGTDANGCSNSTVLTQSVSLCTGIQPVVQTIEANVYPNPFCNKINITLNNTKQTVQIFNALGSLVHSAVIENETIEVDLTNQPSGIYFIKIGSITKKLIKE
jgi:N-acetylneuraminic acid mutarotase